MNLETLYNTIPLGAENSIGIDEIADTWKVSERTARQYIEKMIYKEMFVCNLRNGYFRPQTKDELNAYYNIILSHTKQFERKLYRLRKGIENFDNLKMAL
jgi:hypothetical protein